MECRRTADACSWWASRIRCGRSCFQQKCPCGQSQVSCIEPLPQGEFQVLYATATGATRLKVENATDHIASAVAEGVNPFERAVFVASGASKGWANRSVDEAMTIIKTEATRQGYWCSRKGGFLDTDDVGVLQGFPRGLIPWRDLGITASQQAGLYGNAMNLAIMLRLIPHVLCSAGFLSESDVKEKLQGTATSTFPFCRGARDSGV